MTELLVKPDRAGDLRLVNRFYGLLSQFPNLQPVAPDIAIAAAAAELRAVYGLRSPDALQGATAAASGATPRFSPTIKRCSAFSKSKLASSTKYGWPNHLYNIDGVMRKNGQADSER